MLRLLALFLLLGVALSAPLVEDESAEEYGNDFEGDMIEPFPGAYEEQSYSGLLSSSRRWPGGVVVYKFQSSLPSSTRTRVKDAAAQITKETGGCIKFREATSSDGDKYVYIQNRDSGCSATVGYWSKTTNMKLSPRCSTGTIMHEFQHTLGIYHQQSRSDRDKYVSIALENVKEGHEHNFKRQSSSKVGSYGVKYDFGSQMHYSLTSFSKNGQRTIVPLPGALPNGVSVGQRKGMSSGDVKLVRAMYKC